jgi:hypothetical protein
MLLRRVTEHVREQNWTAIAIDFAIVVLGVFVGIQVANWNAEREDRQRGVEFAERLRVDLRDERLLYEFMVAYYSDVRDAANSAVAALDGQAPLSNHDLLVNAYRATQYSQGARRRSTYDELVSTGSLGLIRDQRMLRAASQLYRLETTENVVRESLESPYRQAFRMSITNDVQRELAKSCGDRYILPGDFTSMDTVLGYPCTLELPPEVVDAAAQVLRSDPNLIRALRQRTADLQTRLSDFTVNNRDVWGEIQQLAGDAP